LRPRVAARIASPGIARAHRGDDGGHGLLKVSQAGVARARKRIEARQHVLESDWRAAQPRAEDENAYLESHSSAGCIGSA
jgi:hypothetical protein